MKLSSYRLMLELLIKAELFNQLIDQTARARVWGSHIKLQAAASLFEMPVFLYTTSQSEHQEYKWMCYTREINILSSSRKDQNS